MWNEAQKSVLTECKGMFLIIILRNFTNWANTTKWNAFFNRKLWPQYGRSQFLTDISIVIWKFWPGHFFPDFKQLFDRLWGFLDRQPIKKQIYDFDNRSQKFFFDRLSEIPNPHVHLWPRLLLLGTHASIHVFSIPLNSHSLLSSSIIHPQFFPTFSSSSLLLNLPSASQFFWGTVVPATLWLKFENCETVVPASLSG